MLHFNTRYAYNNKNEIPMFLCPFMMVSNQLLASGVAGYSFSFIRNGLNSPVRWLSSTDISTSQHNKKQEEK
ncbi:hypothetical protein O3G_MSEX009114 [Manduca sexta]|uniref:Uncharacterized protein n=1 Tax=Manduca sexta TaxID=7130 RepID=A0A921ZCE2_MANSE|nr:hypothetical protein O3G_MSEX009114 [Manduca sexta]